MARKIVITSGKGGVGKTSVTAGLGMCLAGRGAGVLLVDADVGLNNLDVVMGLESRVVYDMTDVIAGKCTVRQALVQDDYNQNLFVMPSAHAYASEEISAKNFRQLLGKLDQSFDYILIDCPAGIEEGFHRAVCGADEAIVVTTPHISAIRDADKVLSVLASYSMNGIHIVVNRVRGDLVAQGSMMGGGEIASALRYPLVGVVPEDDNITVYSQLGKMGMGSSNSRAAFDMIVENLLTGGRRIFDPTAKYRGVIGKLKLWLERGL